MRKKIIAGNWKMNTTLPGALKLARAIVNKINHQPLKSSGGAQLTVIIAPPALYLEPVNKVLQGSSLKTAAQNCYYLEKGAYTGEISASMIKSVGTEFVIIGHSERRTVFHEDDDVLAKKVKAALSAGLTPVFCCGESLEQRENGEHYQIIISQIERALFSLTEEEFQGLIIAYEPVWAIGTGVTATPEQAQQIHAFIRGIIRLKYNKLISDNVPVIYGGSCKPDNAAAIFSQPDIDGGLIGGASLRVDDFNAIIQSI